jgi:hypothetical protein
LNPDRIEWSGDTVSVDEVVERFAYPNEPQALAVVASRFPGVPPTCSPAWALHAALFPLIDGLERMEHGDPEGSPESWSPELLMAYGALIYGSDLVEAWRLFAQLPHQERERVIAAAHWTT